MEVEAQDRPTRVGVNVVFMAPRRASGTGNYSWSLLTELQARDDIELVVFAQDGFVPEGIDRERCEVVSCPTFRSTWARVGWEQLRLPGLSRRHSVDVLWSTGYVGPRFARCPSVVTVHDLYFVRVPAAIPFARRQYYRIFIPASVRSSDAVIAVSQNTADDLAHEIPVSDGKTHVIPSAARHTLIDVEPEPPADGPPFFLMVASVTRNKNVDTLVRAAIAVAEAGHEIDVRIVGEDPYGILAEAMQIPGATDVVHVLGEVDDAELAGLYRSATAVVISSIYEGFGLPVLEAQALGAPVISSRGGALPEVGGDGARYFDHDSPDELAEAMIELLGDQQGRSRLIESGRRNEERFSWARAAEQTAAVLRSAASAR